MNWRLLLDNLVVYSLQIGMLVGVAAVMPVVLRLRQPGAKLAYWQILLAACLLLPMQPWKQVVDSAMAQVTTMTGAVQPVTHRSSSWALPRSEAVLLIVLAGIVIRLSWLAVGFWKLRRYRRHSRPLEMASSWSVEASLRVSGDIVSPVTFGWRKPVVLLPARFAQLGPAVQDAILCHEIMHVRRGDWLFTVAEEVVRAIFWFHPAIWWLLGEIGLAREQEVDRLAIAITREREHYMDALLAIAGSRAQLDLAPAPLFLRKRHLRHRVLLIVQEARMSKARLVSALTAGLATVAAACWLITGTFPLTAEPQNVADAAGVTVFLNGSQVLHRTAVHYPPAAIAHHVQGAVSVEVKLDSAGNVSDARVMSGPDELRSAVMESVLEWHFTRDAANATREVQVMFELPKMGVVEGVAGGVGGGVPGAGPVDLRPASISKRISGIEVAGLSEESRAAFLATLPVHEGDELTDDALLRTQQATRSFDEHLALNLRQSASGVELRFSAGRVTAIGGTPPQKIRVGGNAQSAMIVSKPAPVYPEMAKSARVQGVVHLAVVIGKDGTVQEIHSLGGPALLIQSAMDAVKHWVYKPTLLNGEPVAVETTVDVNYTLTQ